MTDDPIQSMQSTRYDVDQVEYWKAQLESVPDFEPKRYGIPKRFHNCTLDNYKGNNQLIANLKKHSGGNVVFSGNTGVGKTHLAVALMRELEQKQWISRCKMNIQLAKEGKVPVWKSRPEKIFVTVPDLLLTIRESFKDRAEVSEGQLIDRYSEVPLLVLDDLGSEKATDYALTTLYILIDRRYREEMDTIITTNLTLDEIEEHLHARIASRLSSSIMVCINSMPDYRKRRAS